MDSRVIPCYSCQLVQDGKVINLQVPCAVVHDLISVFFSNGNSVKFTIDDLIKVEI